MNLGYWCPGCGGVCSVTGDGWVACLTSGKECYVGMFPAEHWPATHIRRIEEPWKPRSVDILIQEHRDLKSPYPPFGAAYGALERTKDIVRMLREAASKEGLHQKNNLVDELADKIENLP